MRTKTIKTQGKIFENAILMAGGYGCKIYGQSDFLILQKGKKYFVFTEKDTLQWATIMDYVNVKYYGVEWRERLLLNFKNWSERL